MTDDLNDEAEQNWCAEQRESVVSYLVRQGIDAPNVGAWPAWHIAPLIAVWAVESKSRPEWVGWWAISGDVPIDYTTCREGRHPRQALHDIGKRWIEAAAAWAEGRRSELMQLASAQHERDLAPSLSARGESLVEWSADDTIWPE
ncbi:DUF4826 family protein [Novosphingobium kaempferiae]|uniref:DUF4826 family protein n=1 Tax=Novosphingobium kaempferiae TaxID=2896849 RepID=UPI001E6336D8|nr:DUF4826 family protein [Novosphingobium kaempferiae]